MSDGAMTISSQVVAGGNSGLSGDTRTAETYQSDQYSQVQVTSTQLTGSQWIGPAVRPQNNGQDLYLGIYFWNGGSPELRLYERNSGGWTQLGSSYSTSGLAAGASASYTIGGTVSGLSGTVVLNDNGGDALSLTDMADYCPAKPGSDAWLTCIESPTVPSVDSIAADYVERAAALDPFFATWAGIAGHDDELPDLAGRIGRIPAC